MLKITPELQAQIDAMVEAKAKAVNLLQGEIDALRGENAKLRAAKGHGMKVTDKGGLSVYGLGRFPVTLYRSQWEALLARKDEILAFIEANADKLASKD